MFNQYFLLPTSAGMTAITGGYRVFKKINRTAIIVNRCLNENPPIYTFNDGSQLRNFHLIIIHNKNQEKCEIDFHYSEKTYLFLCIPHFTFIEHQAGRFVLVLFKQIIPG